MYFSARHTFLENHVAHMQRERDALERSVGDMELAHFPFPARLAPRLKHCNIDQLHNLTIPQSRALASREARFAAPPVFVFRARRAPCRRPDEVGSGIKVR